MNAMEVATERFARQLLERWMREPINRRRFLGGALRGAAGPGTADQC